MYGLQMEYDKNITGLHSIVSQTTQQKSVTVCDSIS